MGHWSDTVTRDLKIGPLDVIFPDEGLPFTFADSANPALPRQLTQILKVGEKLTLLFDREFTHGFKPEAVPKHWLNVRQKYQRSPENGFRRAAVFLNTYARKMSPEDPARTLVMTFANAAVSAHYAHRAARICLDGNSAALESFILGEYTADRLQNDAASRLLAIYPRDEAALAQLRQDHVALWTQKLSPLLSARVHGLS
ncbi:MAG: hypothetical protein V4621_06395 [Pseudomonadota bacterium]